MLGFSDLLQASIDRAEEIASLEAECFPLDEAATKETIILRLSKAPEFFRMVTQGEKVAGFINGTCIDGDEVHHDSMTNHVAGGRTLVIHSVSVSRSSRRLGVASKMLRDYVDEMLLSQKQLVRILLLSKPNLLQLYLAVGFSVIKKSSVVHGQEHWFECGIDLLKLRRTKQSIIDAFVLPSIPFSGNPAACILMEPHDTHFGDEAWMQSLAMENALSETSFMTCIDKEKLQFTLRWFSPTIEIDLCGHATLASAHYLKCCGVVQPGEEKTISFETRRSGILTATCKLNGEIELSMPSTPPSNINLGEFDKLQVLFLALPGLLETEVIHLGKTNQNDLFLEIAPDRFQELTREEIDFGAIRELGGRGLILSCLGSKHSPLTLPTDSKYDFLSRFFAPRVGIDEDPATGSAHCCLGPHFTRRIFGDRANIGKRLLGYQMSKRGAELGVMVVDERVKLFGYCATIIESTIC